MTLLLIFIIIIVYYWLFFFFKQSKEANKKVGESKEWGGGVFMGGLGRGGNKKKSVHNTWCSQAVTHLSTNQARRCLTSVIGREPVFSTWYGRRQRKLPLMGIYYCYYYYYYLSKFYFHVQAGRGCFCMRRKGTE